MALPHATSPSPNLATVVDLPAPDPAASRGGRRRRGQRTEPASGSNVVPKSVMEDVS
jgi:hypothetical protein